MRALTRVFSAAIGTMLAAAPISAQTIYPIDRATVLSGSRFDLKVEFPGVVAAGQAKVTINGRPAAQVLGREPTLVEREDGQNASSLVLRDATISQPGLYTVIAGDGTNSASVTWEVYGTPGPRVARNVILFIGDGMSVGHVTAARILSRRVHEGRYRGVLAIDTMPHMALIGTSGVDSVITEFGELGLRIRDRAQVLRECARRLRQPREEQSRAPQGRDHREPGETPSGHGRGRRHQYRD